MSTKEIKLINKIRARYMQEEKEVGKFERLKALNKKAHRPSLVFAYIFGSIGTLVLGTGMCLVMPDVITGMLPVGVAVGLVGIFMTSVNYFIYKKLLKKSMKKYSAEIIGLSDELLNNK